MGEVYVATQLLVGRECAVKIMKRSLGGSALDQQRFRREAASMARVVHPNVAVLYDFGETNDGRQYLAMEYVAGRSLRSALDMQVPMPAARAIEIVTQISDGLAAAHAIGIVHRDLKPDNVLVCERSDGTTEAKVIDFGIAKPMFDASAVLTSTGMAVGTPAYMSPEQLTPPSPVAAASDVFSLGILLFEMLTGSRPWQGDSLRDVFARLSIPPTSLESARPEIAWSPALQLVLSRMLALEPELRPTAGAALSTALFEAVPEAIALRQQGSRVTLPSPRVSTAVVPAAPREDVAPARTRWPRAGVALALVGIAMVAAYVGRPWARESTPPPTTVSRAADDGRAASAPASVEAEMEKVRLLIQSADARVGANPDSINAAHQVLESVLPWVPTREDSAYLLFLGMEGSAAVRDSAGVCRTFQRLRPLLAGTSVQDAVAPYRQMFACGADAALL